jgi:putative membrane protein
MGPVAREEAAMRGFFFRLLITALGLWAAAKIVPGVQIDGWGNLLVAALLLGLVNAVIRPVILILTLPLTVLTLGLFILVVNGISLSVVAWLMPGFTLSGLGSAILGSIIVGLTSWFASTFVGGSGRIERYRRIEVTGRRLD